jgi:hypothetical protein
MNYIPIQNLGEVPSPDHTPSPAHRTPAPILLAVDQVPSHVVRRALHERCRERGSGFAFVERFSPDQKHHIDEVLGSGAYLAP